MTEPTPDPVPDPIRVARELLYLRSTDLLSPMYLLAEVFAHQALDDIPERAETIQNIEKAFAALHHAGVDRQTAFELQNTIDNLLFDTIERAAGIGARVALRIDPVRFFRGEYGDLETLYQAVMGTTAAPPHPRAQKDDAL
jgi:hypothetical protein